MKAQFSNQAMSSALLWMDNKICVKGEAFYNQSGYFYPTQSLYNNYYTYACPYSQLIADSSITGATIMTGVYLDGSFLGTGQSGFHNIDYDRGFVYFSSEITGNNRISGNFSVKEVDVKLTIDQEETILFENKHFIKLRTPESLTGINNNEITYPVVYIKSNSEKNEPWTFGGTDKTIIDMRAIILAESQFQLDAIKSILRDQKYGYIPLLNEAEFPFNAFGGLRSGVYNYTGMTDGKVAATNALYIEDVYVAPFNQRVVSQINALNPGTYIGFADITMCYPRRPRA